MSGVRVRLVGTERVIGPVLRLAGEVFEVPAQDVARWQATLGDALEVLDEGRGAKGEEEGAGGEVSAAVGEDGEGSADVTTVISKARRKK